MTKFTVVPKQNVEVKMIPILDGARAIEVMCAVYKSMETNGWVELPLKEEVIPPYYKLLPKEE